MKVCYYNHVGKVSGAEHVLFALLHHLNPEIEKAVISPVSPQIEAVCTELQIPHYKVREFRARFTRNPLTLLTYAISAFRSVLQLRRLTKMIAPDILHANSIRAGMVATLACAWRPTQIVWHAHDKFRPHPISRVVCSLLRMSTRNAVIAVSNATADSLKQLLSDKDIRRIPIWIIHNGVNSTAYLPTPTKVRAFRSELGLDPCTFTVAIIGQITPRKGQAQVIDVVAKLCRSSENAIQLLIVGSAVFDHDQSYLAGLKAQVKLLGMEKNILFLGQRKDVPVVLQSIQAMILNSSSEPFSLVLLEACASRTPVIAANVDGVSELIHDGVNGLLFDHGNLGQMEHLLQVLAADPSLAQRLGHAASLRTLKEFSVERFTRRVEEFYAFILPESVKDGAQITSQSLRPLADAAYAPRNLEA